MGILRTHPIKEFKDELSKIWECLKTIAKTFEAVQKTQSDLIDATTNLTRAASLQQRLVEDQKRFISEEVFKLRSEILDIKRSPQTVVQPPSLDLSVIREALREEKELEKITKFDL